MHFEVIKLKFKSGLHLSKGKTDNYDRSQLVLHSDTLKSALFVEAKKLFGEAISKESFFDQFLISSAFPYLEIGESTLYFLPKPNLLLPKIQIEGIKEGRLEKTLGKIEFIEYQLFQKLFDGNTIDLTLSKSNFSDDFNLIAENVELEEQTILDSKPQHQVFVSRTGKDNDPFQIDKIYFAGNAGLYLLIDYLNDDVKQWVKAAFKLLEDSGLGTDKTTGGGQFKAIFETSGLELKYPDHPNRQINLSLYHPKKSEITDNAYLSYKLIRRGGFIASPQNSRHLTIRKRSVYMFQEGSVFPFLGTRIGNITDLRPDDGKLKQKNIPRVEHPIWRDGQSIFLPIA